MTGRLILAAAAFVVAVQIACTLYLSHAKATAAAPPGEEVYADYVKQVMYDGAVVRIELARGRLADDGHTERTTVARILIPSTGAEQLYQNLATVRAHAGVEPVPNRGTQPGTNTGQSAGRL